MINENITAKAIADNPSGVGKLAPSEKCIIEPVLDGAAKFWEGHHATNPCVVRLPGDQRVFLGYRAGGVDDWFMIGKSKAWASHLGLAILDQSGEEVLHRLPLPIMRTLPSVKLPKSIEEYEKHQTGPFRDTVFILHDFRFWNDGDWLYLIYHEGTVSTVFDCIVRMKCTDFIARVDASIRLMEEDAKDLEKQWFKLWWADDTWKASGVDGSNRIYGSKVHKNDIAFIRTDDDEILMLHRPMPDIAMIRVGQSTHAPMGEDGIAELGCIQRCIRPGFVDNSHIGNNGSPVRARIGEVPVFLDITHGVFNRRVSEANPDGGWQLSYFPYLRILDARNGSELYYSEEPVMESEDAWPEYSIHGEWVRNLDHLDLVTFAGGQIEKNPGKNGVLDEFVAYFGAGDTSVAYATFRLVDVVPPAVLKDICRLKDQVVNRLEMPACALEIPGVTKGWRWTILNDPAEGSIRIVRKHSEVEDSVESTLILPRPGYFDAHGLSLLDQGVSKVGEWAWMLTYAGYRCESGAEGNFTEYGAGIILIDHDNPERILFRSRMPISGTQGRVSGWTARIPELPGFDPMTEIPVSVMEEGEYIHKFRPMKVAATKWLIDKAEAIDRHVVSAGGISCDRVRDNLTGS